MADQLADLAVRFGTDKGPAGPTSRWPGHNYADVYEAYLGPLRDTPLNLLEIGLGVTGPNFAVTIQGGVNHGGGASAKMWLEYFPNAQIHGIDINPAGHLDGPRLRTAVADQSDPVSLQRVLDDFGVTFDVIIDDGSHHPEHQQTTLGVVFDRLAPGGLYFVEDLAANGLGDAAGARQQSSRVRNTREVLRDFAASGRFGEPHCIPHPDAVAEHIDAIRFHCPEPTASLSVRRPSAARPAPFGTRVSYRPGSERLCVIARKSASA